MSEKNSYGGKAKNLFFLQEKNYNTPSFFVITHDMEVTENFLEENLSKLKGEFFAVRSSATLEDGSEHSFAGLFESFLLVPKDLITEKVAEVKNSLDSNRVNEYLNYHQLSKDNLKMNVIIQEMIEAETSGVAFGRNILFPEKNEVVISAVHGLGIGLVNGDLNADEYKGFDTYWKRNIPEKKFYYAKEARGISKQELPQGKQNIPCLSEAQCQEIQSVLLRLEKQIGSPQDIEFSYLGNKLYLLQTRPITSLPAEPLKVWDNSNIVESYPGITLPFTFSFIISLYETVYKNIGILLGVSKEQIVANDAVFKEMLGYIKGRVYYNLENWYKALSMLPAYKLNAGYMEKMMGVSEPLGFPVKTSQPLNKWQAYVQFLNSIYKIIITNKRLTKDKKAFQKMISEEIKQYETSDLSSDSIQEIWRKYKTFKGVLVNKWNPPLANDLFAMFYFGSLEKFCLKNFQDKHLHTSLIINKHDLVSTEPAYLLEQIINCAAQEGKMVEFKTKESKEIYQLIKDGSFGETGCLISQYIHKYGDRSVGELKLENDTFKQKPEDFISLLSTFSDFSHSRKMFLSGEGLDEMDYAKKLSFFKRKWFLYLVKKASETVADRENLRFDRTRVFGMVRQFINEIGVQLQNKGAIHEEKDIFYLTEAELNNYIENESLNIKEIIQHRKKEFASFEKYKNLPNRIYQRGELKEEHLISLDSEDTCDLEGLPCREGIVNARVRVLSSPKDVKNLNGDILVTKSTDPGWITIFRSASGVIVERGSTLSHAAIVCREMGIPCIVAAKGVTSVLKTGDLIQMNGGNGKIELIEEN